MIKLGQEAKDKITGFNGILTARLQYITGCDQYTLTPKKNKEGGLDDCYNFDEKRLEIIGKGILPKEVTNKKDSGGPHRKALNSK